MPRGNPSGKLDPGGEAGGGQIHLLESDMLYPVFLQEDMSSAQLYLQKGVGGRC